MNAPLHPNTLFPIAASLTPPPSGLELDVPEPPSSRPSTMPATPATLPAWLDAALIHALCKTPQWTRPVIVGDVRRLLVDSIDVARADQTAIDLLPMFCYLASAATHGHAARCVNDIADALTEAGVPVDVPAVVRRRTLTVGGAPSPLKRAPAGTFAEPERLFGRIPAGFVVGGAAVAFACAAAFVLLG